MSAGDFYIRRNSADTTSVPNAGGGNEDAGWDTLVHDEGSIATYTDPNIRLGVGLYLVMYSERFYTSNTTNNERIEIQGEIHVSGTGAVGGYGQDYIRKIDQQDCVVSGSMFLQVTAADTDVFVRFYRTDDSTTGTTDRVPGFGGITILEMDDASHSFGFYSTSASEATSTTVERTLNLNTNDKQDTGFSRTGSAVTITNAGRYLVTYNMDLSTASTARELATAYLRRNSTTEVVGSRGYTYLRSIDGAHDGAISWIGIVDLSASDTLDVRWSCPTSATVTAAAGATLQCWQIPTAGDEAIMEATTGDYNADADFAWDTLPHIDTASFTATAGNANIDVDQTGHFLMFGTFGQAVDSAVQRAYPLIRGKANGQIVNHAAGGGYHRNSATSNFSTSVALLAHNVPVNASLIINTSPIGADGSLANTRGQFSVLALESIWNYAYPPIITNVADEQIDIGEVNIVIDGDGFESTQGVGKVELVENSDYTGTKVTQTIDSWSNTAIQFDSVQGALVEGSVFVFVTTNGGKLSAGYKVNLGEAPYSQVVADLLPDHLWMFNNSYNDDAGANPANDAQDGNPSFTTVTICRSNTHALNLDGDDSTSPANSTDMNSATQTRRVMGGWFMIENIQSALACIYEEGAQINNYCFVLGMGNKVLCQAVDDGGFNIQVYGEKPLLSNRPYHLCWEFSGNAYQNVHRLYVDGAEQTRNFGNPPDLPTFPSHTGNIEFGGTGTTLEVGGTDIVFAHIENGNYAAWATWRDAAVPTATQIKEDMFEAGAKQKNNMSGTKAAMQTAFETYDATTHPDWPLTYRVAIPSDDANPTFTLTNQIFHDDITLHVRWLGSGTLTFRNSGTSNLSASKASTPNGGTVAVINTAPVKVTVKDIEDNALLQGARVEIIAGAGGPLTEGVAILEGSTDSSGVLSGEIDYTTDQAITGKVRLSTTPGALYRTAIIAGTITSTGYDGTILMVPDE